MQTEDTIIVCQNQKKWRQKISHINSLNVDAIQVLVSYLTEITPLKAVYFSNVQRSNVATATVASVLQKTGQLCRSPLIDWDQAAPPPNQKSANMIKQGML